MSQITLSALMVPALQAIYAARIHGMGLGGHSGYCERHQKLPDTGQASSLAAGMESMAPRRVTQTAAARIARMAASYGLAPAATDAT